MLHTRTNRLTAAAVVALAVVTTTASADTLISNTSNNGFFTPFNAANVATTTYGDSWWIGSTGTAYYLTRVTIGFATFNGTAPGSTDINVGIHDGDPSGLVFGPGTSLYSTTITNVTIPGDDSGISYFSLSVDLPNVQTSGGFNNVGLSISLSNYNFGGQFGMQLSTAAGQTAGFYTNNASYNPGNGWSLFSFGADSNTGIGNYFVTFEGVAVPVPGAAAVLGFAGVFASRRRR